MKLFGQKQEVRKCELGSEHTVFYQSGCLSHAAPCPSDWWKISYSVNVCVCVCVCVWEREREAVVDELNSWASGKVGRVWGKLDSWMYRWRNTKRKDRHLPNATTYPHERTTTDCASIWFLMPDVVTHCNWFACKFEDDPQLHLNIKNRASYI